MSLGRLCGKGVQSLANHCAVVGYGGERFDGVQRLTRAAGREKRSSTQARSSAPHPTPSHPRPPSRIITGFQCSAAGNRPGPKSADGPPPSFVAHFMVQILLRGQPCPSLGDHRGPTDARLHSETDRSARRTCRAVLRLSACCRETRRCRVRLQIGRVQAPLSGHRSGRPGRSGTPARASRSHARGGGRTPAHSRVCVRTQISKGPAPALSRALVPAAPNWTFSSTRGTTDDHRPHHYPCGSTT